MHCCHGASQQNIHDLNKCPIFFLTLLYFYYKIYKKKRCCLKTSKTEKIILKICWNFTTNFHDKTFNKIWSIKCIQFAWEILRTDGLFENIVILHHTLLQLLYLFRTNLLDLDWTAIRKYQQSKNIWSQLPPCNW